MSGKRSICRLYADGTACVRLVVTALLALQLGGCVVVEKKPPPLPVKAPVQKETLPKETELSKVVLLVSNRIPAYTSVAKKLATELEDRVTRIDLKGDLRNRWKFFNVAQRGESDQIVSVGLLASQVARAVSNQKNVIFCQVFNYNDHELINPRMKGVSALPSPAELFYVWKQVDPSLDRVAVVTGKNLGELISQIKEAAQKHDIELIHRVVNSDRQLLYEFKRLSPAVKGLWLIQDNRVLSRSAIQELMVQTVKDGTQVVVSSAQILKLGGLMSANSVSSDIADKVLLILRKSLNKDHIPGPGLTPLSRARIRINQQAAERLGLVIPGKLKELVYAP